MPNVRDILVTGANRSGTTWAGGMLAHSGQLRVLHEPFNPGTRPRWTTRPLPHRNLYVCADNEAAYRDDLVRILAGRRPFGALVRDVRSTRDVARLGRGLLLDGLPRGRAATLLKDPIAVFSAPWLASRFDLNVVLMVRNPGAFVSSLLRLDWRYDFHNLLDQPLLMRDLLGGFEREIADAAADPPDVLDQGVLLWRIHYAVIDRFRREHPDWICVRWEDLADDPVAGFAALYGRLGLSFHGRASERVLADNAPGNVIDVSNSDVGPVRRDSRATATAWVKRLTDDGLRRIRDGIGDAALPFYAPAEWLPEELR